MPGHLHFTSPQAWHHTLAEAVAAAADRCILVQVGRPNCGGSRALVEKSVAKEEILEYLAENYVCVSADADSPEPAVAELIAKMEHRDRTPYCLFLDGSGKLLHSTSGGRPPAVFLADLIQSHAIKQQ